MLVLSPAGLNCASLESCFVSVRILLLKYHTDLGKS